MKKRITSSVVAFMVLSSSTCSASAFDLKDNFFNSTNSATWTDPSSGVTYHSGPNLEYRFQSGSKGYAPWLQMQLPSARVGCNGFSIKGGFLALIGLDDIKQQLTDAGASFAWGVMMVMVQTLPGVSDVFQKLQEWSRRIQSLLQNACSLGKAFAEKNGLGAGTNSLYNDAAAEGVSVLKQMGESIDYFFDSVDKYMSPATESRVVAEQAKTTGSNISMFSMALGESIQGCNEKDHKYTGNLASILDGEFDDCDISNMPSSDKFEEGVLSYKLTRAIFGDIGVNEESITPLLEKFDSDGKFDQERVKSALMRAGAQDKLIFGDPVYTPIAPAISDAREAALWFIFGDNGSTVGSKNISSYTNSKKIYIPNNDILYINVDPVVAAKQNLIDEKNLPSNQAASTTTGGTTTTTGGTTTTTGGTTTTTGGTTTTVASPSIKAMYVLNKTNHGTSKIELKWGGAYEGSRNNILYYVNKTLVQKLGSKASNYTGTVSIPAAPVDTLPMLTSSMNGYLNVIVEDILATGSMEHTMPLIELLALYNAQVYAEQLVAHITMRVYNAQNAPNVTTDDKNQQIFLKFNADTKQVASEIRSEIYKMKQSVIKDTQAIDNVFERVKKQNAVRRSQIANPNSKSLRKGN